MEHFRKKSLYTFMNDEITSTMNSPQRMSAKFFTQPLEQEDLYNLSPSRISNQITTMYSPNQPPSSDSSRTVSPLPSPSPTLFYNCIASLHRQEGIIYSIAVSRGIVYTGSNSRRIRAWRQPDCLEKGFLKARSGEVRSILAYGNLVFTSHKDFKVRIWHVTSTENFRPKKISTLPRSVSPIVLFARSSSQQHRDVISCMGYYHAEGLLYTGSKDKTVKAWRISDGKCVDSFVAHDDSVNAIMIHQDDGCVFTCSSDGCVKIWRRLYGHGSHTLTMTLKFQASPIHSLALSNSPRSCFLYSGSSDGFVNFWEKEAISNHYNHGGFLQGHRFSVLCLVAKEMFIFSGSEDTTIRIWRREEGSYYHECLAVMDAHRGPVRCLVASLEMENFMGMGFLVYSVGLDHNFKVWRVKVLFDEKKVNLKGKDKMKFGEYEISPVLSPSWVERKLQENPK